MCVLFSRLFGTSVLSRFFSLSFRIVYRVFVNNNRRHRCHRRRCRHLLSITVDFSHKKLECFFSLTLTQKQSNCVGVFDRLLLSRCKLKKKPAALDHTHSLSPFHFENERKNHTQIKQLNHKFPTKAVYRHI